MHQPVLPKASDMLGELARLCSISGRLELLSR
jgi:hypothetical protein